MLKAAVTWSGNHPDSTNAVFWEVPGDLLGDTSNHDNALAFKHCQMRA
jgi:hypothetical protein